MHGNVQDEGDSHSKVVTCSPQRLPHNFFKEYIFAMAQPFALVFFFPFRAVQQPVKN